MGPRYYPVPLDMDQQETILKEVSDQRIEEWEAILDDELDTIQSDCLQADIDFEFVIDSSGSVGASNWQTTMNLIGEYWIKDIVYPNGAKTCGNHVAGRWFSSDTERFYDFEPPARAVYSGQTYAEYVGEYFINQPFNIGGTNTALALEKVREEDLPMARNGLKYVMMFTDGASNNAAETAAQASLLNQLANRTYAFGITSGINMDELHNIASNPAFVAEMANFEDLKSFVRLFMLQQKGCGVKLSEKKPHRAVDLSTITHYGMSYKTAEHFDDTCSNSTTCPDTNESVRNAACVTCSEDIGMIKMYDELNVKLNFSSST